MKKIILLVFLILISFTTYSQCINGTLNSSIVSSNDGFTQTLASNVETNEFITVTNLIISDDYLITSTRTGNNDYITVTNTSNAVISHGVSPLQINSISDSSIRVHIRVDAACNTDTFFHLVTIQNLNNAPTCYEPENPGISYKSNSRIDFYWSAPSMGTPVDYDWEIVPAGNAQGIGVIASGSTGGITYASSGNVLSSNTSYSIYVRSDCNSDGTSIYLGPLNFTTNSNPPPSNDFCNGAITIIEETGIPNAASATPTAGTLLGGAGTNVNAESCGGTTGNARDDVWYKFIAQTSNVFITVQPSPNFDVVATLYNGDCNSLSYLACSDVNISSPSTEEINYTGLTIGQYYYVRTYFFGSTTPVTPTFSIKIWSTTATTDNDNDGYSNAVDCNDNNAFVYPGAPEIVGNGIDENCDGQFQWYQDSDGDGYGSTSIIQSGNSSPGAGESSNSIDCNDSNASINPGATDIVANGIDENCDGQFQWYLDSDGDTYGSTTIIQSGNASPGAGESNNSTDCDDTRSGVNPGATEIEGNGLDDDCDSSTPDIPLGIEEFEKYGFSYYPNPVRSSLILKAKINIDKVDVYNMLGQEIIKVYPNNKENKIDMTSLQNGLYFVKVLINDSSKTIQIIKQ